MNYHDRGAIDLMVETLGQMNEYSNRTHQTFPNQRSAFVHNYREMFTVLNNNSLHQDFQPTQDCMRYGPFTFISAAQIILQTE